MKKFYSIPKKSKKLFRFLFAGSTPESRASDIFTSVSDIDSQTTHSDSKLVEYIRTKNWEKCLRRLSKRKNWSEANAEITIYVLASKSKGYPLHAAIQHRSPPEVIMALLKANRKAAATPETLYGWYPLHLACMQECDEIDIRTISALLQVFPEGASEPDHDGDLPLHFASTSGAGTDILEALLAANLEAAMEADLFGDLPLHLACRRGKSVEIVKTLLEAGTEGAQWMNLDGCMPLHVLCSTRCFSGDDRDDKGSTNKNLEEDLAPQTTNDRPKYCDNDNVAYSIAQILIASHPDAVRHQAVPIVTGPNVAFSTGPLPLHLAIKNGASLGILDALLMEYPCAIHIQDECMKTPADTMKDVESVTHPSRGIAIHALLEKWGKWLQERKLKDCEVCDHQKEKYDTTTSTEYPGENPQIVPYWVEKEIKTSSDRSVGGNEELDEFNVPIMAARQKSMITAAYYSGGQSWHRVMPQRRHTIIL